MVVAFSSWLVYLANLIGLRHGALERHRYIGFALVFVYFVYGDCLSRSNDANIDDLNVACSILTVHNKLKLLCLNCCRLNLRLNYPEFGELICQYDVICLQETKKDDTDQIYTTPIKTSSSNLYTADDTFIQNTNLLSFFIIVINLSKFSSRCKCCRLFHLYTKFYKMYWWFDCTWF
jgi:hypothetical protein